MDDGDLFKDGEWSIYLQEDTRDCRSSGGIIGGGGNGIIGGGGIYGGATNFPGGRRPGDILPGDIAGQENGLSKN